jgi:hypothetical protein
VNRRTARHSRTVGQTGVDHRRHAVETATDRGEDALDHHLEHTRWQVCGELRAGGGADGAALDPHFPAGVHQHLAHIVVVEPLVEWAEAEGAE